MSIITGLPTDADSLAFVGPQGYLPSGRRVGSTDYAVTYSQDRSLTALVSTPTLSVAGAYATGDYVGPSTTPASFAGATAETQGFGRVRQLVIVDKITGAAAALELWLLNQSFVAPTDNAAWAISDTEALNVQAVIDIPTTAWYASANNKVAVVRNLDIPYQVAVTTLFYGLVARGATPTWTNGDLRLLMFVEFA